MDLESDEKLAEQKAIYEELGYTDCSEIKDRNYFHSIYCRCPGGILVECAATAQGAFARDEAESELGTHMLLPPWFEEKRAEIMAMLDPIRVPEGNIPKDAKKVAAATLPDPAPVEASGVSRRKAEFIASDKSKKYAVPTYTQAVRLREAGQSRGLAERAGILLHGRSRTKQEMLNLAAGLEIGGTRWIAPYADNGLWYPGRFMEPLESNEPFLTRSVERCHRLVLDASEGGRLAPHQLFIVGFSQGACIAVEYVLRHAGSCGAIVLFSGSLMGPPGTVWRPAGGGTLRGLQVFITGSDMDEWIPEERSRETARVLTDLGADVDLRIYPSRPHMVSNLELAQARAFLRSRLVEARV
jgi:predicted esterase